MLPVCVSLLVACSATDGSKPFIPKNNNADQIVVYVYRPTMMANAAYSLGLYVDGILREKIRASDKILLTLPPGEHVFEIDPDKNYTGVTRLTLDLNASTIYFLRVDAALKISNSANYEPYQRSFSLIEINSSLAAEEITRCCNAEQVSDKHSVEIKASTEEPAQGFSVDKTQNPFSR